MRQGLRVARRQKLDQLYNTLDPELRTAQALPLLLAVYDAAKPDDRPRLLWVAEDLLESEFSVFASHKIHSTRLNKLARILITTLERQGASNNLTRWPWLRILHRADCSCCLTDPTQRVLQHRPSSCWTVLVAL